MRAVEDPAPQGGVIELDVSGAWEPPAERPRLTLPGRRWLVPAVVLLAVLGAVAGSTSARPLRPVFQLSADIRQIVSAPGMLVALVQGVSTQALLRAYRVGDFSMVWEVPVTGDDVWAVDDVLLVSLRSDPEVLETRVLDAATGRDLWRRDMSVLGRARDLVVLADGFGARGQEVPPTTDGVPMPTQEIIAVDRRTGDVRWSASTQANVDVRPVGHHAAGEVTGLVEIDPTGEIRTRDVGTGMVRSSTRMTVSGDVQALTVTDDVVVVDDGWLGHAVEERTVRAFGTADGRPLWERVTPPDQYLTECGVWLCESGPAGTAAVDPRTGRTRWQSNDVQMWREVAGDRAVVTSGGPMDFPPELSAMPRTGSTTLAIVDMRTGQVERKISGWEPTSSVLPGGRLLVGQANQQGHARVGVLDLAAARLSLIGTVTVWSGGVGAPVNCVLLDRHAACQAGLELAVWRLPSTATT